MRISWLRRLTCVIAVVLLTGCSWSNPPDPALTPTPMSPVSVSLTLQGDIADQPIRVGVLIGPTQGQGSEYRDMAEGARIATYRFAMTGADVDLVVALENGTSESATHGLQKLANQGVIGIVAASSAPHLTEALAGMNLEQPILLPYEPSGGDAPGVWITGPSLTAISQQISRTLKQTNSSKPYVVTSDNVQAPPGVGVVTEPYAAGPDLPDRIVKALTDGQVDSVIVAASAATQADLVAQVQGNLGTKQAPIILTPQALTPTFGQAIAASSVAVNTISAVGADISDAAALSPGPTGSHASAFFTALRLAADDPSCLNIHGDSPFANAASTADIASHDAVIALIRAAERASSTSPDLVKAALGAGAIMPEDGLAGPTLDFTTSLALDPKAVTTLRISTIDPGVRPQSSEVANLSWFATS